MLTPVPFDLGLVIMGDNQPAFDAVCCAVIGVDPRGVEHIRVAHEQGLGPIDLDDITSLGTSPWRRLGAAPGGSRSGCHPRGGVVRGHQRLLLRRSADRARRPGLLLGRLPRDAAGGVLGPAPVRRRDRRAGCRGCTSCSGTTAARSRRGAGEKVVFVGGCATWRGRIGGREVVVDRLPVARALKDPHHARHQDIYAKMVAVTYRLLRARGQDHVRLPGCPISVAEQVLMLSPPERREEPLLRPAHRPGLQPRVRRLAAGVAAAGEVPDGVNVTRGPPLKLAGRGAMILRDFRAGLGYLIIRVQRGSVPCQGDGDPGGQELRRVRQSCRLLARVLHAGARQPAAGRVAAAAGRLALSELPGLLASRRGSPLPRPRRSAADIDTPAANSVRCATHGSPDRREYPDRGRTRSRGARPKCRPSWRGRGVHLGGHRQRTAARRTPRH